MYVYKKNHSNYRPTVSKYIFSKYIIYKKIHTYIKTSAILYCNCV